MPNLAVGKKESFASRQYDVRKKKVNHFTLTVLCGHFIFRASDMIRFFPSIFQMPHSPQKNTPLQISSLEMNRYANKHRGIWFFFIIFFFYYLKFYIVAFDFKIHSSPKKIRRIRIMTIKVTVLEHLPLLAKLLL